MTAEECLKALKTQKLRQIDNLPDAIGVYALADHLGDIHYIGITVADSFRDRIYRRHVNGSEERSHKLACNYNIGRMWRDRKSVHHVPHDAQIAKNLRREFIRRHCQVACVALEYTKQALEKLEQEIFAIALPDMISWNATRTRVNRLPEPRDLVDALIEELRLGLDERAALARQAKLFEMLSGSDATTTKQTESTVDPNRARQMRRPEQPKDVSESRRPGSENKMIAIGSLSGFERITADGERYVAHLFKDGYYRMANPSLGRTKHHAENQLAVTLDEISEYLSRGYLLRMRSESSKQVNLISPSEIAPFF